MCFFSSSSFTSSSLCQRNNLKYYQTTGCKNFFKNLATSKSKLPIRQKTIQPLKMKSTKFYEIRTTLPARGGIMGDCNVLSKFSQMPMCYSGVPQDILSSLRKPCPGDCYYFCSRLGVSTFQIGRQGFSSGAENSSALLPSTFQPEATTSKTALPPAALQVSRAVAFVPLICHQEKGRKPVVDPVLTRLPSIPYLMGHVSAPISQRQRRLTSH